MNLINSYHDKICFFDNQYVPLKDANINIQTNALQYGTACIGGLRAYWNPKLSNLYILKINAHYKRLLDSIKIFHMDLPYTIEDYINITTKILVDGNWKENVYIRPIVYKSDIELSPRLHNVKSSLCIYVQPLNNYLDINRGLKTCISSWVRIHENQIPTKAKSTAGYLNSALAKSDAIQNNFDEAIFLDIHGNVAEGSAENIFIVKNGYLITPSVSSSILEGITRKTVLELASDLGIPTLERTISRTELFTADEVFLCGTGVQIAWVKSVDHRTIGNEKIGKITQQIQKLYFEIVTNNNSKYKKWLFQVYKNATEK